MTYPGTSRDTQAVNNTELSLHEVALKIKGVYKYLRSQWITLLKATIIGILVGLAVAYIYKPRYTAELSFTMEDSGGSSGSGATSLASRLGLDLGLGNSGGAFSGNNIMLLMKSRLMVEKALLLPLTINGKVTTLAEHYIAFNELRNHWKNNPSLHGIHFLPNANPSKFTLKQDSLLGTFYKTLVKKSLSVEKLEKKSSIIKVRVESTNELFSKCFIEKLVESVVNFYIEVGTRKTTHNISVLQHQTDSVKQALDAALKATATHLDVNPHPNPSKFILTVPSQRKQVDVQTNAAILSQLVSQLEIAKVSLRKETPLIQVIDRPIYPLEKKTIGWLKGAILGAFALNFLAITYLLLKKLSD